MLFPATFPSFHIPFLPNSVLLVSKVISGITINLRNDTGKNFSCFFLSLVERLVGYAALINSEMSLFWMETKTQPLEYHLGIHCRNAQ